MAKKGRIVLGEGLEIYKVVLVSACIMLIHLLLFGTQLCKIKHEWTDLLNMHRHTIEQKVARHCTRDHERT